MTSSIENREPDMAIREDSSSSENEDDEDNIERESLQHNRRLPSLDNNNYDENLYSNN